MFMLSYLLNPRFCHSFVGYLEEQAVHTYTTLLKDIDNPHGCMREWNTKPAPEEAIKYYNLQTGATMRDVVLSIRADEACHRDTNHFFSEVDQDLDLEEEKVYVKNKVDPNTINPGF